MLKATTQPSLHASSYSNRGTRNHVVEYESVMQIMRKLRGAVCSVKGQHSRLLLFNQ